MSGFVDVAAFETWIANEGLVQRERLTALERDHLAWIAALADDDHRRALAAIKKRLKSPKLAEPVAALLARLARTYAPKPAPPEPAPPPPRPASQGPSDLAEAIALEPQARETYLVYADWLIERGDPRGELINLTQHDPKAACDPFVGPLAGCADLVTEITYQMSFVAACRVAYTSERFNAKPAITIPQVIAALLDDPGPARFIQALSVGMVMHDDQNYHGVVEVLAKKLRAHLRRLVLGDFTSDECELNWCDIGPLAALWPRVPQLRTLVLRAGSMAIGPIDLPHLEQLETITGGLDPESLGHLGRARWPALRTLSLQIGLGGRGGAATDVGLLAPLLAGDTAPALRDLGILNCEFTDELCAKLVDAPLLPRLATLDLSMGTMSDDGAAILAANAARFAHLARITVDDNYLTATGTALLDRTFPARVVAGAQRFEADPEDRRASAYE